MTKEGQNQGSPKALIFGGTTEGRLLCEFCAKQRRPVLYCVASADGARPVEGLPGVEARAGRLDRTDMDDLLTRQKPSLVVDATHPYAREVSENIAAVCRRQEIPCFRIRRTQTTDEGCIYFDDTKTLLEWLGAESGKVFVTLGSSAAKPFTELPGWRDRVWLRILPNMDRLSVCLDLGYRPDRLVCMQGPFSEDLNRAMFQAADARILVTKNSGAPGGFSEKVRAAQNLGMKIAVLARPKTHEAEAEAEDRVENAEGITVEEACRRILEVYG